MNPTAIYISGPMRGHPEFNFPAFFSREEALQWAYPKAKIFSPARRDLDEGFDPSGFQGTADEIVTISFDLRKALLADCTFICEEATHIEMLPGWTRSTGATAERALGLALGLSIMGAPA